MPEAVAGAAPQAAFWLAAAQLRRTDIAARVPHAGSMCLLDGVHAADAERLVAWSGRHQQADNPLRRAGRLGASAGVEWAAQAMALHGALCAQAGALAAGDAPRPPRAGYLVNVRNLELTVDRLDEVDGALRVQVQRDADSGAFTIYDFQVLGERQPDHAPLLRGRAYVLLAAPDHAPA